MRLLDDIDEGFLRAIFLPLPVVTLDDITDPSVSVLPVAEVPDDRQAKHTPLALQMFAGILCLALPFELNEDKLLDRRVLVLLLCRTELTEDALEDALVLRDRLLTLRFPLVFSLGRVTLLLADELFERRAFLAARLRRLAVLDDTLLAFRLLLTPRFFATLPLKDLLEELRRFFVLVRERLPTLLDDALPDRRTLSAELL